MEKRLDERSSYLPVLKANKAIRRYRRRVGMRSRIQHRLRFSKFLFQHGSPINTAETHGRLGFDYQVVRVISRYSAGF